ncbi:MAG: ATP-binding cassette domain-containing protein [Mycoplasmatales bacterium]
MIKIKNLKKSYEDNIIFENLNLEINFGDFLAIYGVSGRGKTTLLNIIGMIEPFDSGSLSIGEVKIDNKLKNKKVIRNIRRNKLGYLFQNFALLENEDIYTNLKIPFEYEKIKEDKLKKKMKESLLTVGLSKELDTKIYSLSGGEQQRVAIAKLLMKNPQIILADEPTGSLDKGLTIEILNILNELNKKYGVTIIMVTHDDIVRTLDVKVLEL